MRRAAGGVYACGGFLAVSHPTGEKYATALQEAEGWLIRAISVRLTSRDSSRRYSEWSNASGRGHEDLNAWRRRSASLFGCGSRAVQNAVRANARRAATIAGVNWTTALPLAAATRLVQDALPG